MTLDSTQTTTASPWRSWCYLVWLSWQRQMRARLMVWVAVGLLAFMTFLVYVNTQLGAWTMIHWRSSRPDGPMFIEYYELLVALKQLPGDSAGNALRTALVASIEAVLAESGFLVFSNWVVFSTFATFLLPLWSLSFATEALGREREDGNLIWLLSRPLSRSSIYLGKFLAILPWSLLLNVGGFALLCVAGGKPGQQALRLYWPAVLWGTLAFCSLFHLMGAWFGRPAVVGILYCFFLETLVGNLPGYLKRASISFYIRCMMFDAAHDYGVEPERPSIYLPVDGTVAWVVLAGLTVGLLLVGMIVFSRKEYLSNG